MKKERDNTRTEEVQDIIDRMPTRWTTLIMAVTTAVILAAAALSVIIKYPDCISGDITITGVKAPLRLVSSASGNIHLLAGDGESVDSGMVVAYIDCGACIGDVLSLEGLCSTPLSLDTVIRFRDNLSLGPLSAAYSDFVLAYRQYDQLRRSRVYDNMRASLYSHCEATRQVDLNILHELELMDEMHVLKRIRYEGDSTLFEAGAISGEELTDQRNSLMEMKRAIVDMNSTHLEKVAEMSADRLEISRLELNLGEELASAYQATESRRSVLHGEYRQWKRQYLLVAPAEGTLEHLDFWRENEYVPSGREVFSVSPAQNRMVGEMLVPVFGSGKIKRGQHVDIRLHGYPHTEFGYVRGVVASISDIVQKVPAGDSDLLCYKVRVELPHGTTSNYGIRLGVNYEAGGTAHIVTAPRRLIQRLFDNLKSTTER
ncbi:MAG: HlyD family secretion protein [Bacteroidaceae bacterium]